MAAVKLTSVIFLQFWISTFNAIAQLPAEPSVELDTRVLPEGQLPNDQRLGPLRHLNSHFPFRTLRSLDEWKERRAQVRRRILFANGMWPMPERPEPRAVIHGKVKRDGYTVERVFFESYPGHFVTGSLYRPVGKSGPFPAVLSPYGHWEGGRFQDLGEEEVLKQISAGAERFEIGGRHPLQARCVQLAKMGCVVFMHDMLGYADSQQIGKEVAHDLKEGRPEFDGTEDFGFLSTQADLRMLSPLGLQTYNSLCALDFLASLPDVDDSRIGVTGGSGGATQTLMLCSIDDRISAAFAAVMVSTAMQGGCPCENACCLRVDAGNVDFAALFAPKPLGMASADDWTKNFQNDGYPELRALYDLYAADDKVALASLTQFKHNYNYETRARMYEWFNKHLKLGQAEPIVEDDFIPLTVDELTVWNSAHSAPTSGPDYERTLLRQMAITANPGFETTSQESSQAIDRFRNILHGALDVLIGWKCFTKDVSFEETKRVTEANYTQIRGLVRNSEEGTELPALVLMPNDWHGQFIIWAHGAGKSSLFGENGQLNESVSRLLDADYAVVGADLLYQGEFLQPGSDQQIVRLVDSERDLAAYTYGYNRTLFSHRTVDILNLVGCFSNWKGSSHRVHVFGLGGAAPWASCARAIAGAGIETLLVDTQGFRFSELKSWKDENFLPGAVKYGDLPAMMAMSAPHRLYLAGEPEIPELTKSIYSGSEANQIVHVDAKDNAVSSALVSSFLADHAQQSANDNAETEFSISADRVGPAAMPESIASCDDSLPMPRLRRPTFPERTIDIANRNAKSGVATPVTKIIQACIDELNSAGGGTVRIPPGKWSTGRIILKSNVCLHVCEDAELLFSGQIQDYLPVVFSRIEGVEAMGLGGLIYAYQQENIAIVGRGKLTGPGGGEVAEVRKGLTEKMVDLNLPVEKRIIDGREGRHFFRPYFICPIECKDVFIEGVSLRKGPMWNVVPIYCDRVIVRGVSIDSRGVVNGDGVNIESSRNVLVEYCSVATGDDCYALKAGRNADGVRAGRSVENVVMRFNHARAGYGGITCGSETAGGIRNVHVHDCLFENVRHAAYFKTRRPRGGGGEHMLLERIRFSATNHAVFFDMLGMPIYVGELANRLPARPITELTPYYRDIVLRDLAGTCRRDALKIYGIPESPASRITMEGCDIRSKGLINLSDAEEVTIRDSRFYSDSGEIKLCDVKRLLFSEVRFNASSEKWTLNVSGPNNGNITFESCSPALAEFRVNTFDKASADEIREKL